MIWTQVHLTRAKYLQHRKPYSICLLLSFRFAAKGQRGHFRTDSETSAFALHYEFKGLEIVVSPAKTKTHFAHVYFRHLKNHRVFYSVSMIILIYMKFSLVKTTFCFWMRIQPHLIVFVSFHSKLECPSILFYLLALWTDFNTVFLLLKAMLNLNCGHNNLALKYINTHFEADNCLFFVLC